MGQVCLVKKDKKTCGVLLCQAIWCCSFLFMYQEKWKVTGKWKQNDKN